MDTRDLFWSASPGELMRGYKETEKEYVCLICETAYVKGVIYPDGDRLLEAQLAAEAHIAREHSSTFAYMLGLDRKLTGLSEIQQELLQSFKQGQGDKEIAARLGLSASTIRSHRFKLRERERQAKVFLALMGLLNTGTEFVSIHKGATAVDERYATTQAEEAKILSNYIREGKLTVFPAKEKRKLIVLRYIAGLFAAGRSYSEKEVNEILEGVFSDYVTIRRYLIEYGFMERNRDCSEYKVKI